MGETTTRLASVTPRAVKGVNIGGGALRPGGTATPARAANHASYPSSQRASRSRRFSWLMRWLRVSIAYMNCGGSSWSQ